MVIKLTSCVPSYCYRIGVYPILLIISDELRLYLIEMLKWNLLFFVTSLERQRDMYTDDERTILELLSPFLQTFPSVPVLYANSDCL